MTSKEIAQRIRDKVVDLNDELILAAIAEVDIDFIVTKDETGAPVNIRVWCSQEIR